MNRNRISFKVLSVLATALVAIQLATPLQAGRAAPGPDSWLAAWRAVPYTTVSAGMKVEPTQSFHSPNGRYHLRYQKDGRLGLYDSSSGTWTRIWLNAPPPVAVGFAAMQANGNFVTRGADQSLTWSTGTADNPGAFLAVRDDGDLVIVGADKTVKWARPDGPLANRQKAAGGDLIGINFG